MEDSRSMGLNILSLVKKLVFCKYVTIINDQLKPLQKLSEHSEHTMLPKLFWWSSGRYCMYTLSRHLPEILALEQGNRNTRTRCELCSKLTLKTPERDQWCRSFDFILWTFEIFVLKVLTYTHCTWTTFNFSIAHRMGFCKLRCALSQW